VFAKDKFYNLTPPPSFTSPMSHIVLFIISSKHTGTSPDITNLVYTKLAAFPSRKISGLLMPGQVFPEKTVPKFEKSKEISFIRSSSGKSS
jgi:hypothetical protein